MLRCSESSHLKSWKIKKEREKRKARGVLICNRRRLCLGLLCVSQSLYWLESMKKKRGQLRLHACWLGLHLGRVFFGSSNAAATLQVVLQPCKQSVIHSKGPCVDQKHSQQYHSIIHFCLFGHFKNL